MKTSICALVLALGLGATDAFVSQNANNNRGAIQLNIVPINGGVEGSTLVPGQYERVPMTVLKVDQSQGGQARKSRVRESRLNQVIPPFGALIQTTGGLEVSSKMSELSPSENLALASARTMGTISAPYRAAENFAPPGVAQEKQGLQAPQSMPSQPALGGAPPMNQGIPAPVAYEYAGGQGQ